MSSTIKEPKYYKTIKYVGKPGIDLSKVTTHNARFCYCTKSDEIVEYRAGYCKGIQRHYLESHTTKKEKDKMAANTSNGKTTKEQGSKSICKGIHDQRWKEQDQTCCFPEAKALADVRKELAAE
jgi:hypothetical protein